VEIRRIEQGDTDYPAILAERLAGAPPQTLYSLGDPSILQNRLLGLICSIQCPGSIIIRTFDVIREIRDAKAVMIGGFHSPMERECLDLLLRGSQPVILCPARGLHNLRIGKVARKALKEGRLLVLSIFGDEVRRTTSARAILRNDLVTALAHAIFVPHASPDGKTWAAIRKAFERGQKVFSLEDEANTDLLASGARAYVNDSLNDLTCETGPLKTHTGST